MAEAKILTIFNLLFVPLFGYTMFALWNTVQGWILFSISIMYAFVRLLIIIKRHYQNVHKENQEAKLRDLEIKRQHLDAKEIELKQLERELSIQITGLTPEQREMVENFKKENRNQKNK